MKKPRSRRAFLGELATASAAVALGPHFAVADGAAASVQASFESGWHRSPDGRLECITAASGRNVHLLSREIGEHDGTVAMSVRLGRLDGGAIAAGKGAAGFAVGVKGPLKAAISQTIFTAMATHHGPKDQRLVADYDTNAWPQSARNRALREMRKVFAFHLAGDQHLPTVVHYGIDAHRDAVVAFASPAVNNLYSRRFRPEATDAVTGDFRDSFGHPLTVLACANPQATFRPGVLEAELDKSAGFGVVRFDRRALMITVECWPLLADPLQPGSQFPGWPVVVSQLDNYARQAVAHLPALRTGGTGRPLIDVIEETTGETVYRLRLPSEGWRPPVFAAGRYTLRISEPDGGRSREVTGLEAGTEALPAIDIWSS